MDVILNSPPNLSTISVFNGYYSITTGTSIGSGFSVYNGIIGNSLQFKTLLGTSPIVLTNNANDITFSLNTSALNTLIDANITVTSLVTSVASLGINVTSLVATVATLGTNVTTLTNTTVSLQTQINGLTTSLSDYLLKTGGTMSGAIAMGSSKITGLAAGTVAGDAVNKAQLDAATIGEAYTNVGISYASGWAAGSSAEFKNTGKGTIRLKGTLSKANHTNGEVACTLPAAYRPSTNQMFIVGNWPEPNGNAYTIRIDFFGGTISITQCNWTSGTISSVIYLNIEFDL